NRIGKLLTLGSRFRTNLSCRIDRTLLLDRGSQVGNRHSQFCQLVWLNPDTHRVIGGAKVRHLSNAGDSQNRVVNIDGGIVTKELTAVSAVWRVNRKYEKWKAHQLLDRHPILIDGGGKVRASLRHPVLGVHLVDIYIGPHVISDLEV